MHPVDGEIAAPLLRPLDEIASQASPGGLWRHRFCGEYRQIIGDPGDGTLRLEQIEHPTVAPDVVVGEIKLGDTGICPRKPVPLPIARQQLVFDDPVDLAFNKGQVLGLDRLEGALPEIERTLDDRSLEFVAINELGCLGEIFGLDLQC